MVSQNAILVMLLAMGPLSGSSKAFCVHSLTPRPTLSPSGNRYEIQSALQPIIKIRGGMSFSGVIRRRSTTKEEEHESEQILTREERARRRGMSLALTATYLTVMGAKCALPSVLSLLTSKTSGLTFPADGTPQSRMANLLRLSTLAVAAGKLLLGPVIDTLGGIWSLQVSLSLLMGLLATIACTQQFSAFAPCWILVDFIFSSCWAGCINAIHQSFPENKWGSQIGLLAVGARTGGALSFTLFASILYRLEGLKVKQPWRQVFAVSAIVQLLPILMLHYFGGKTLKATHRGDLNTTSQPDNTRPSLTTSLQTLKSVAATPEFWFHLISRSVLMVFASFLLFVPTLLNQVYGSSSAVAAEGGSIYSLGCLLAVTLGSSRYSKLPKKQQALASVVLTGLATISSLLQLAHVSGVMTLSAAAGAASMFLWGFAFAVPFYIPASLYALSRGGKQSSATIADVFDIGGFALLALFNGYVASIDHATAAAWIPTFLMTTACSLTSLIALPLAILRQ